MYTVSVALLLNIISLGSRPPPDFITQQYKQSMRKRYLTCLIGSYCPYSLTLMNAPYITIQRKNGYQATIANNKQVNFITNPFF